MALTLCARGNRSKAAVDFSKVPCDPGLAKSSSKPEAEKESWWTVEAQAQLAPKGEEALPPPQKTGRCISVTLTNGPMEEEAQNAGTCASGGRKLGDRRA